MNGKTTIDPTLNPCSAEMDRKTYGADDLVCGVCGGEIYWFINGVICSNSDDCEVCRSLEESARR